MDDVVGRLKGFLSSIGSLDEEPPAAPIVPPSKANGLNIPSYQPSRSHHRYTPPPVPPTLPKSEPNAINLTSKFITDNFSSFGTKGLHFLKSSLSGSEEQSTEQTTKRAPTLSSAKFNLNAANGSAIQRASVSSKPAPPPLHTPSSTLNLDEYRIKLAQVRSAPNVKFSELLEITSRKIVATTVTTDATCTKSSVSIDSSGAQPSLTESDKILPRQNSSSESRSRLFNRLQTIKTFESIYQRTQGKLNGTVTAPVSQCNVAKSTNFSVSTNSVTTNTLTSTQPKSPDSIKVVTVNQCPTPSAEPVVSPTKKAGQPSSSESSAWQTKQCDSNIAARPNYFVRSLSSSANGIDTPSPRSPHHQADYLCPPGSTQVDPENNIKLPVLTTSDILLEVRTKSIERIILSLMQKLGTLVNSRDRPIRNDKHLRAIVRVGQSVNFAVERFAAVGEAIADDNPEIRNEMYDACKDARAAGSLIEQLCSLTAPSLRAHESPGGTLLPDGSPFDEVLPGSAGNVEGSMVRTYADRTAMSRAARALLSSVTRVLLVADTVVVKQIVASKDRVSMSMNRLENVANFTEFVKAFSHFGMEMVELAQLTSDRQQDLKNEKRRAQMAAARRTLERSTMMLLTTSKACLRHPDCQPARDNRDTVFAQMRRAMDLIHFVVKEGIIMYQAQTSSMMAAGAGGASGAGPGTSSPHHFHRPTSSSSSSSLHLPFDPHNEALLYGGEYLQHAQQSQHRSGRDASIPKYQRRGQLHRTQRAIPGGSFVLAVESTLRWLHEQLDTCPTIVNILRRINELLDLARMGPLTGPVKEQIVYALDAAIERTQDFTDSAYTNHEHRERILLLCDQIRTELGALFRVASCLSDPHLDASPVEEIETSVMQISKLTSDLRRELQDIALEQADELFRMHSSLDLPLLLKTSAIDCDHEQVDELIEQFREHSDHVQEVCRLLFHVAPTAALQVTAGHTETSIEIHSEQLLTAFHTLMLHSNSKIVKENYEVFADVWSTLVGDITQIMRDLSDCLRAANLREQMTRPVVSVPPPPPPPPLHQPHPPGIPQGPMGAMGSPSIATAPVPIGPNPVGYMAPGLEPMPMTGDTAGDPYGPMGAAMPPPTSGGIPGAPTGQEGTTGPGNHHQRPERPTNVSINPEVDVVEIEKWPTQQQNDMEENDIVRKAKSMSAMAMSMFQFTRGEGDLKTTQDLFTQAEFFADEANKLYKIVRHFTYQIPAGAPKKELLDCIDQVPTYVQQLQFAVKNVTVGKTATFTKVDNVIQETKNLMAVITRVVTACINCASTYNLDMQGALRSGRSRTLSPSYRSETEMFFEGGAMSKGGVASSDPDI